VDAGNEQLRAICAPDGWRAGICQRKGDAGPLTGSLDSHLASDGGAVEVHESDSAGDANLQKVDHVVIVMLENRSFDHMLGYLCLSGRRPEIDGLRAGLANEYQGRAYSVHHLTATALGGGP
jgi:phospholipase C